MRARWKVFEAPADLLESELQRIWDEGWAIHSILPASTDSFGVHKYKVVAHWDYGRGPQAWVGPK